MFPIDIHKIQEHFLYQPDQPLIFNSGLFLFLFTGFLAVYLALSERQRPKLVFVTLFSLYFYYKSSGMYFLLLVATTLIDFWLARKLFESRDARMRKLYLVATLVANLGILVYFKYTNFFASVFFGLAGQEFQPLDIFLPVGVSFFTFQSLSYTLDVYRGQLRPVDSILDYAFFVSFFPQLVAGPIVRASDFLPQIARPTVVTQEMLGHGVFLIGCGLFKKAVISDYISTNFVDRVFDAPALYAGLENLMAVYGYALQIYCDFSGYSDMAIGIALVLGFRFPMNFDSPYQSRNITEFWRRWHISLSSWLRDYLYIPLGGNRRGRVRMYANQMITMLLGGLWHGASWRFVLWGALHGIALAGHKYYRTLRKDAGGGDSGWRRIAGTFITFHFVCFCWIFFRAPDLIAAGEMIGQMLTNFQPGILPAFLEGYSGVMMLMAIGYLLHFMPREAEMAARETVVQMSLTGKAAFLLSVIMLVIQVKSSGIQPFIYFQF